MFTTVNPLPVVDFTGLDAEYCANSVPDTLFGNSIGGGFTAEGLGTYLIDLGNDTAVFYPALVSAPSTVEISYYFTNANGCSDTITKTTFVNALTEISFTNIDDTYCRANPALTIVGSESPNPNGIFNVSPYLFPNPGIPGEVVFDLEQAFPLFGRDRFCANYIYFYRLKWMCI